MATTDKKQREIDIIINASKADASINDLAKATKLLNQQVKDLKPGTEEFVNKSKDLGQIESRMKSLTAEMRQFSNEQKKSAGFFSQLKQGIAQGIGQMAAYFSVDAIKQFAGQVLNVTSSFQKFEAVLTNTLGSKSEAQKALQMIQDFATQTPFSVEQLTDSFVKLANRGFVPTREEMRKLGDLAASTGKDFDQLAEAILDAQTGEFERLKEFGVRAQKEGDKVKFTFKGVTSEVQNTESAIRKYITGLGDLQGVSGSMAAISRTLEGQISNLGDSFDQLLLAIGTRGSGGASNMIGALNSLTQAATDFIKVPLSAQIRAEKDDLNALVSAIRDTNTSNEARKVLIDELNQKYPEFTKKIDVSKASDEELRKALSATNKEYETRIFLLATSEAQEKYNKQLVESIAYEANLIKQRELVKKTGTSKNLLGFDIELTKEQSKEQIRIINESIALERKSRKDIEKERQAELEAITAIAKAENVNTANARQEADAKELADKKKKSEHSAQISKEAAENLQKQAEEYAKKRADAEKQLQDLLLATTQEGRSKDLLDNQLKYNAEIAEIKKRGVLVGELTAAAAEANRVRIREINLKWDAQETQDYIEKTQAQLAQAQKFSEELGAWLEADAQLQRDNRILELQNQFLAEDEVNAQRFEDLQAALLAENEAYDQIQADALQARYDALVAAGQSQTSEALKIANQLNKIDIERNNKAIQNQKALIDAKSTIAQQEVEIVASVSRLITAIFGQSADAQRAALIFESAATIASIIMNTQKAIFGFRAQMALVPGGPALAEAYAINARIQAGLAIGTVLATNIPKFIAPETPAGKVDKKEKGGYLYGPSHAQGGMKVLGTNIEVEGGEYIVNKVSTARNRALLEAINARPDISYTQRRGKYETGGILPNNLANTQVTDNQTLNNSTAQIELLINKMEALINKIDEKSESFKRVEMPLKPLSDNLKELWDTEAKNRIA